MTKLTNAETLEFFSRHNIVEDIAGIIFDGKIQRKKFEQYFSEQKSDPLYKEIDIKDIINVFNGHRSTLWNIGESEEIASTVYHVSRFINDVLSIKGLDRLHNINYVNTEWGILTNYDFEKDKPCYTRDHFMHQYNNALLVYELLYANKIYKNHIIKALKNDIPTARYINSILSSEKNEKDKEVIQSIIILKTLFISAFFHDIGYPIKHYFDMSAKMDKYMPYLHIIDSRNRMEFIELKYVLADSYLFRTRDIEEIEKRFKKGDHGALSAICLLLNYYSTGTIHQLSEEDKCAIELSASVIYMHTFGLDEIKDSWEFDECPIEFIFHVIDDIQEWSRFNISIDRRHNTLYSTSGKAVIRYEGNKKYRSHSLKTDESLCDYKCGSKFDYKKLVINKICDDVNIEYISDQKINIYLNYDKEKMIDAQKLVDEIGGDHYYKFRLKELNRLDELLANNPELKIELGYPLKKEYAKYIKDNTGEDEFNIKDAIYKKLLDMEIDYEDEKAYDMYVINRMKNSKNV